MADAPLLAAYTQLGQNSRAERVAASRVVLTHARSREDLHELLQMLGLNQTTTTAPILEEEQ